MIFLSIFSVISGFLLRDLLIGPGIESFFTVSKLDLFRLSASNVVMYIEWLPL